VGRPPEPAKDATTSPTEPRTELDRSTSTTGLVSDLPLDTRNYFRVVSLCQMRG